MRKSRVKKFSPSFKIYCDDESFGAECKRKKKIDKIPFKLHHKGPKNISEVSIDSILIDKNISELCNAQY